jgi:NAD(P)-dependent dehydrogenase (short-subunit alcohol dehydrogenase family)
MTTSSHSDRVAVVTGAGTGIGRAIAHAFARDGLRVVVNDLRSEHALAVCEEIRAEGGHAQPHAGDISDEQAVASLSDTTRAWGGRADVLVNNAAVGERAIPIEDQDPTKWERVIAVSLRGPYLCSRRIGADFMIPAGFGRIVNISSVIGLVGHPMMHAYASAKAGVIMFTKTLATEWARYGITVNAIAPGYIETEFVKDLIARNRYDGDALRRRIPAGRLGATEDIARATSFLAAPETGYVTGVTLPVDGGWTAFGGAGPASTPDLTASLDHPVAAATH